MADHLGDTVRLLTRALMDTNREGAAACLASMLERLRARTNTRKDIRHDHDA